MAKAPTVMVSSTFYDLKEVRSDLASFLGNDLGFQALLSELPSFPIEPDHDTLPTVRNEFVTTQTSSC